MEVSFAKNSGRIARASAAFMLALLAGGGVLSKTQGLDVSSSVYQKAGHEVESRKSTFETLLRGEKLRININAAKIADQDSATKRIVDIRAHMLHAALEKAAEYDGTKLADNANLKFLENVINEADYAAKELQIPRRIVLSQWAFESGRFQQKEAWYIDYNNLGGFMSPDVNGTMKLEKFSNLHEFALSYVKTMKAMGVEKTYDIHQMVAKMGKAGYFVGPTVRDYEEGVKGVYGQLGALDKQVQVSRANLKTSAR